MRIGWTIWLPMALSVAFAGQLFVIALAGPENGSAKASLLLALGFGLLAGWQIRQRRTGSDLESAASHSLPISPLVNAASAASSAMLPPGVPVDRRRFPRFPVDWPAEIVWHHARGERTRLRDLSRGGARLEHGQTDVVGRRGLLLVPGLNLPIPFTVVGSSAALGLHIRFDLEGMGLDELEQQLQALTALGGGVVGLPSLARP